MRYNAKKMPHASLPGCLTANHIKNQYPKSVGRPVYQFFWWNLCTIHTIQNDVLESHILSTNTYLWIHRYNLTTKFTLPKRVNCISYLAISFDCINLNACLKKIHVLISIKCFYSSSPNLTVKNIFMHAQVGPYYS